MKFISFLDIVFYLSTLALVGGPANALAHGISVTFPTDGISSSKPEKTRSTPSSPRAGWGMALTVSSWIPQGLSPETAVTDATPFNEIRMPRISGEYFLGAWFPTRHLSVRPKAGIAFQDLSRSGTIRFPGVTKSVEQRLSLLQARFGAELSSPRLKFWQIDPYFGLVLEPSIAMVPRSSFGDAWNGLGVPVELSIGNRVLGEWLTTGARWLSPSIAEMTLDIGFNLSAGKFGDLDFFGTGVHAGLRTEL